MFGLMRVRTHDAEMAKVQETLVIAARALGRAREERETLQSRLDALTPARGQGGRFAKREAVSNG